MLRGEKTFMGNMTLEQVNDMYLDVLREIGNIGAEEIITGKHEKDKSRY